MARRQSRYGPPSFKPAPPKSGPKKIVLENGSFITVVEPEYHGERLASGAPRPAFLAPPTKRNFRREMAHHVKTVERLREHFFSKPRSYRVSQKSPGTAMWVAVGDTYSYSFMNPFQHITQKRGTEDVVSLNCPGCNAYVNSTFWLGITVDIPCTSPFAVRGASRTQEHMLNFCLPCTMVACGVMRRTPQYRTCAIKVSYETFLKVIDVLTEPEGPYRVSKFEKFQQSFFDLLKTDPAHLSTWKKEILRELSPPHYVSSQQVQNIVLDSDVQLGWAIQGYRGQGKSSISMRLIGEAIKKMEQNGIKPSVVVMGDLV